MYNQSFFRAPGVEVINLIETTKIFGSEPAATSFFFQSKIFFLDYCLSVAPTFF